VPALALDLETIAADLGPRPLALLAELAAKREDLTPEAWGALCPPLARVVAVGFLALESKVEHALYDSWALPAKPDTPGAAVLGERVLLHRINHVLKKTTRIVTFNGRAFDVPVLIHRMLIHRLPPARVLVEAAREHRYHPSLHVDVLDLMTLHGAATRYALRAYALAYGFADFAEKRTSGADIAALVAAGDTTAVVRHALDDVRTTAALYERWAALVGPLEAA
jgi:hypothetical protein